MNIHVTYAGVRKHQNILAYSQRVNEIYMHHENVGTIRLATNTTTVVYILRSLSNEDQTFQAKIISLR